MAGGGGTRLVVLDRDGVINADSPQHIKSADEWRALPGSIEAIARLWHSGWTVTIATNQSGIGRGLFTVADLHKIHAKLARELSVHGAEIAGVFFCPHAPDDDCECRKPRTGLLRSIASRFNVALDGVPVIGDSERDLQAAADVGARPMLVRTGNGEQYVEQFRDRGVEVYDSLAEAANVLIDEHA